MLNFESSRGGKFIEEGELAREGVALIKYRVFWRVIGYYTKEAYGGGGILNFESSGGGRVYLKQGR